MHQEQTTVAAELKEARAESAGQNAARGRRRAMIAVRNTKVLASCGADPARSLDATV